MQTLRWLAITLLLVLALASPGLAMMVTIEAASPLPDDSKQSVRLAVEEATETAVQAAVAMGLLWIHRALVLPGMVIVQILASVEDFEEEGERDPGPGVGAGQPPRLRL